MADKETTSLKELSIEHQQMIEALKDQLLIVFLKRLGGKAKIPAKEIDKTSKDNLSFRLDDGTFYFEVTRK